MINNCPCDNCRCGYSTVKGQWMQEPFDTETWGDSCFWRGSLVASFKFSVALNNHLLFGEWK